MYTPRKHGGLGVVHGTPMNPQPDVPIKLTLFKQPGYVIEEPTRIKRGRFTWVIAPFIHEKNGRMGVDILVRIEGIEPGEYLRTQFTFQQPGNVRQTFDFTFDDTRVSFLYRRALTIPQVINKNGEVGCHYSHFRFLRNREDDEPLVVHDGDCSAPWVPQIPFIWERKNGAWRYTDSNPTFLADICRLENRSNSFLYYFFIEHMVVLEDPPEKNAHFWPKHSQSAKWKVNKEINVDENWFLPAWQSFKTFMSHAELLSLEDFDHLVDVLGHYYHGWCFNDDRLVELVTIAERFGFYDFPQYHHSRGHFKSFTNSIKSVASYPETHPLHVNRTGSQLKTAVVSCETHCFPVEKIRHSSEGIPASYHIFKAANDTNWTLSYERNTYMGTEYLSVYLMMNGVFAGGEHQKWTVILSPLKDVKKLPKREHSRMLNMVQRTMCFPVCYYWKDVEEAMKKDKDFTFKLTVARCEYSGFLSTDILKDSPATGVITGEAWHDDPRTIGVNLDFVRASCGHQFNVDPQNPHRMSFTPFCSSDTVHFLDHLYHGSKLYTPDLWKHVHQIIRLSECFKLMQDAQRLLIRGQTFNKESNEPENEVIEGYDLLEFYFENRDILAIENYDDFLIAHPEPLVQWELM